MEVRIISTTSTPDMSPEELIVYTARVSNPGNQHNKETSDRLIAYLIRNKHWSPFEMADMTVEIKTSRAIAQQILRHRSFSFQEFSQRYAEVVDTEPVSVRRQGINNRQSSSEEFNPGISYANGVSAQDCIKAHLEESTKLYKSLLESGVAKETARMVLPLTTQTTIYMKGSVRSWIHYLQIRCDEHTQLEHREIAEQIRTIFKTTFPNIYKALWDSTTM